MLQVGWMFDELHNMSMCSNDHLLRWMYLYICVEIVDMYFNVVDSCRIISNDYELTMGYDMIVCKSWFQIDRYDLLDIWNMCEQLQETCLVLAW